MSLEGQTFYPGETATPGQLLLLAHEYRLAAEALLASGRRGEPLSRAPFRLVAIHALELYLNALLASTGHPPARLRSLHHDLATRMRLARADRLVLRKRTLAHLMSLSENREYLVSRYDPATTGVSELNRLSATLAEVARKVTLVVDCPGSAVSGPPEPAGSPSPSTYCARAADRLTSG